MAEPTTPHQGFTLPVATSTDSATVSSMTTVTLPAGTHFESGLHHHETFILHAPAHVPAWVAPGPHMATPLELALGITSSAALAKWWVDRWRAGGTIDSVSGTATSP